jgi:hypothetical protein
LDFAKSLLKLERELDGRELARLRETHAFERSKNSNARDMGPLGGPAAASR